MWHLNDVVILLVEIEAVENLFSRLENFVDEIVSSGIAVQCEVDQSYLQRDDVLRRHAGTVLNREQPFTQIEHPNTLFVQWTSIGEVT